MRLVADANVLLSALIGGRASLVLTHPSIERVYAAAATLDEVHEYASELARKKRVTPDVLLMSLASLPVVVVERAEYADSLPEAVKRIGDRDPDDVDALALALHLQRHRFGTSRADIGEQGAMACHLLELFDVLSRKPLVTRLCMPSSSDIKACPTCPT